MKNKAIIILSIIIVVVIGSFFVIKSIIIDPGVEDGGNTTIEANSPKPINLSIYLDLSDRIKPDGSSALSQKDKDMAIVGFLTNYIKDKAVKEKILPCKDRIKVFFYPAPSDSKIAMLSEKLELDLGTTQMAAKKKTLVEFGDDFQSSMEQIYTSTINTSNWQGSDIWGFFNKPIDNYCIKEGYRNILVVLTDGYIFYAPDKRQVGDASNFILNQTLSNPNSKLIMGRDGMTKLDNLEVLMLELNPDPLSYQPKMEQVITAWLNEMGVEKCYVGETDVPSNTKMIIENFLNE